MHCRKKTAFQLLFTDTLKRPETFSYEFDDAKKTFIVGPALLETRISQEKPEHLVRAPACPSPKLPH